MKDISDALVVIAALAAAFGYRALDLDFAGMVEGVAVLVVIWFTFRDDDRAFLARHQAAGETGADDR